MNGVSRVLGAITGGCAFLLPPVLVGAFTGSLVVAPGTGWPWAEGLIVGGVLALLQVLGLHRFGRHLRLKRNAERLAARNANIRAGIGSGLI